MSDKIKNTLLFLVAAATSIQFANASSFAKASVASVGKKVALGGLISVAGLTGGIALVNALLKKTKTAVQRQRLLALKKTLIALDAAAGVATLAGAAGAYYAGRVSSPQEVSSITSRPGQGAVTPSASALQPGRSDGSSGEGGNRAVTPTSGLNIFAQGDEVGHPVTIHIPQYPTREEWLQLENNLSANLLALPQVPLSKDVASEPTPLSPLVKPDLIRQLQDYSYDFRPFLGTLGAFEKMHEWFTGRYPTGEVVFFGEVRFAARESIGDYRRLAEVPLLIFKASPNEPSLLVQAFFYDGSKHHLSRSYAHLLDKGCPAIAAGGKPLRDSAAYQNAFQQDPKTFGALEATKIAQTGTMQFLDAHGARWENDLSSRASILSALNKEGAPLAKQIIRETDHAIAQLAFSPHNQFFDVAKFKNSMELTGNGMNRHPFVLRPNSKDRKNQQRLIDDVKAMDSSDKLKAYLKERCDREARNNNGRRVTAGLSLYYKDWLTEEGIREVELLLAAESRKLAPLRDQYPRGAEEVADTRPLDESESELDSGS